MGSMLGGGANGASDTINTLLGQYMGGGAPSGGFGPGATGRGETNPAAATAFRQLGEVANYPIGQVDVRTPFMQMLESASAPALLQALLNPQGVAQQFAGAAGAPVPGAPGSGLSDLLFGKGAAGTQGAAGAGAGGTVALPTGGRPSAAPPLPTPTQQPPTTAAGGPGDPPPPPQPPGPPPEQPPLGGTPSDPPKDPSAPADPGSNPKNPGQHGPFGPQLLQSAAGASPLASLFGNLFPKTQFMAGGGQIDPRAVTVVGEKGPEAIIAGHVVPLHDATHVSHMLLALGAHGMAAGGDLTFEPSMAAAAAPDASSAAAATPITIAGSDVQPLSAWGAQGVKAAPGGPAGPGAGGGPVTKPPLDPAAGAGAGGTGGAGGAAGGTGLLGSLLQNNPEQDAYNAIGKTLTGQGGVLAGGNAGANVVSAMQPVFGQNLNLALNDLTNKLPSVYNSAAGTAGNALARQSLNDFNLQAAQALQGGQQTSLQGMGLLGQLASQAGQGAFGRALGAGQLSTQRDLGMGQLGLQSQQQAWSQAVNPTMQLLLAALGQATPTAFQTVIPGQR